jgi:hypothetical protein
MKRIWFFLNNVFISFSKRSYKKLLSISLSHVSILEAKNGDTDIMLLFTRTLPLYNVFINIYEEWTMLKGDSAGETKRFKNLLDDFPTKMYNWDLKIQAIFPETSPEYTILMPKGKKPFYNGTYDQRVSNIGSLSKNLLKYPALASVQTEVQEYYTELAGSRKLQQQKVGLLKSKSEDLKSAYLSLGNMLYANLGMLINKYATEPKKIQPFFDLELIRSHSTKKELPIDTYSFIVTPNSSKEAGISFEIDTEFLFYNNSNVPLEVFTGAEKDSPIPAQMITIAPGEEKKLAPNELGAPGNHFLFVVNNDMTEEGEIEITLLK